MQQPTVQGANVTDDSAEQRADPAAKSLSDASSTLSGEDPCQIPQWGGCCCTCRYHIPDMCHPWHDGGRKVTEQKGWICAPPLGDMGYGKPWMSSNWTEHGMCEMQENAAARTEGTRQHAAESAQTPIDPLDTPT